MRFWECRRAVHLLWLKMSSRRGLSRARRVGADDLVAASDLVFLPGQGVTLGVTVEHLGATMWTSSAGQYVATGGFDWGSTYTMQHNPLNAANAEQDAYLSAVAAVNASGWPDYPVATIRPGAIPLYLGEGAPLYAAGLGTVSLCPLPTYLLRAGDAQHPDLLDLDKLDKRLMYGEILTFARAIQALDATPSADL